MMVLVRHGVWAPSWHQRRGRFTRSHRAFSCAYFSTLL